MKKRFDFILKDDKFHSVFMRLKKNILILICIVVTFLSACQKENVVDKATEAKILLMNNGGEPSAIDPQFAQPGVIENRLMLALFEGLVRYNPKTLEPTPALAKFWTISSDGLSYIFKLRENAQFSDGHLITAEDFLFSYQRILSPKLASPCASLFFAPVKNAKKYLSGELDDFSQVGFSVIDKNTLKINLETPCPYFLSLICHFSWSVVPKHQILKFSKIDERSTQWTRPENFVGSGPFSLKEWRVAYSISVVKNNFYWDVKNIFLNGITFDAIEDQFSEMTAFYDGQYHITNTVPPSRIPNLIKNKSPFLRLDPYLSTAFIRINCSRSPLNDLRVRRALSLSLNRKALAERVMRAGEIPAKRLVPAAAYGGFKGVRDKVTSFDEDVSFAQKLLAEAGFPNGKDFPELTYLYNTSDGAQFFAQAIQEMWRENLGITVNLKNQEYKVYRVSLTQGDYDLARSAWSGDYMDPTTFLELFTSKSGMNWTFWKNQKYDEHLAIATKERDINKRMYSLYAAENELLSEMPIIPTVYSRNKFLISPMVEGWYPNLLDIHPYHSVSLRKNNLSLKNK